MNKLPPEILKIIFDHLHYSQKLQCKLVCREWAYVLQSGLDIESVAIPFRTDEKTGSRFSLPLIEQVENGIINGENCRRLILLDYPDRALLAKLFPNLKLIYFQSHASPSFELPSERIGYLQNWHKSLEAFMDSSCDKMALSILNSGLFQKLTTIKLIDCSRFQLKLTTLADKLQNAPNLKNLDLNAFQVDIAGLEKLHSNVPCLESLVLQHCTVESPRELSSAIQHKNKMKELTLIGCSYIDGFTTALSQYIVRTCSPLERFSFIINGVDFDEIHHTIQRLARTLRALNTNIYLPPLDSHLELTSLTELTSNAPFLEELKMDVRGEMSLITPILQSDTLINTIHSLSLYQMPRINFELFNRFSHLKQLCLVFADKRTDSQSLELDAIIDSLPESLDDLKLKSVNLELSTTHTNNNTALPIKSLTLKYCELISDLSGYLSHRFPKLKTLVIDSCETQFDLELPNHYLSFVEFNTCPPNYFISLKYEQKKGRKTLNPELFKLTTGNTSKFYENHRKSFSSTSKRWNNKLFGKHDYFQYDIKKPSTIHRKESELDFFHFRCASVQTFLLNDELIL